MPSSIDKTLHLLGMSKNKAAVRLLESALSSSSELIRQLACQELVTCRGVPGLVDLISRADLLEDTALALFDKHRDRMVTALRNAITREDPRLSQNAFRIILSRQYFEMIPPLLRTLAEKSNNPETCSLISEVIDQLSVLYVQTLEEGRQRRYLREVILPAILRALSPQLLDFHREDSPLIPTLFLRLYPYLPVEYLDMAKIIRDQTSLVFRVINRILLSEDITTACNFVFYCLNSPNPPPLAQTVFSKRMDVPFLERIFVTINESASTNFTDNLKGMQSPEWLGRLSVLLDRTADASQKAIVTIIRFAHMTVEKRQSSLLAIFRNGKPTGRLAALELLAAFSGEQTDQLIWQACDDSDPVVQSMALKLLHRRNLPNATVKILQLADSPHELVRETVQSLLPEFRFRRFLETFDQMSAEQRSATFKLIKKLDTRLAESIRHELQLGESVTLAKVLLCIEYGGMVTTFEDELCELLLRAENPVVRAKVAKLLIAGRREISRGALIQAFHRDASSEVRLAAKASLEKRPTPWEVK